ncbi:efflux RND transporter periplasmic adaptor subunit [Candidatus Gracilibacteria bacterium]|nr:efflux RND transporter periplasmic adaptor subunit [Candidatus Gracilibacteria bacterium]
MASASPEKKRSRRTRNTIIGVVLLALLAAGVGSFFFVQNRPAPVAGLPPGWAEAEATSGTIESTVSATGNIEAAAESKLSFQVDGIVNELLIEQGDLVESGQILARLDATDSTLKLQKAESELKSAQTDLEALLVGASEAEVAEARARVAQAQQQYTQTASSVSSADIAAARADLEAARVKVADLQSGPESDDLAAKNEAVVRAQTTLDKDRTDLSAKKEQARLDVETAANTLRTVQDEYSRIYWQNRELDDLPGDLPRDLQDQEAAALRRVQESEATLEKTRLAYEQAKEDEIQTLQAREAELSSAVAARDALITESKDQEIAAAQAEIARAQAKLAELTGAKRQSDLGAQASSIDIAQAGLEKVLEGPGVSEQASKEAAIVRAELELKQAQRDMEKLVLTAPFAATVAAVNMNVGERAGTESTITLADLTTFHIDLPVDELDVAQVVADQQARITLDALPDREFNGRVTRIAPLATRSAQGTTTYEVTVELDGDSPGVRPGMTAVVEVVTSVKEDTVLVPRRALLLEDGKSFVRIWTPDTPADPISGEPAFERREVTTGLSNSQVIEILSGLEPGTKVLVQDVVSTFNPSGPPQ